MTGRDNRHRRVVRRECDLVVVGAGPAGLYATFYAGFRGLRVVVIDSLTELGGQVSTLFPEKAIFDVAGFPAIVGRDLISRLQEQAASAGAVYLLGRTAIGLTDRGERGLLITLDDGAVIAAGAVLVSAGVGGFQPRQLPAAAPWLGRGMEYFVQDAEVYRDLDVVITGGGDSAVDWALHVEPIARSVTLVHRRSRFRAHESSIDRLLRSSVQVLTNAQVSQVLGVEWIDSVEISEASGGSHRRPAQALVCALGFVADLGPLAGWGMEIANRRILVDSTMRTSLERVFAVGDVSDYRGKVRLISVGFGEAAIAVNHIAALLRADAEVSPGHSSDRPAPVTAG